MHLAGACLKRCRKMLAELREEFVVRLELIAPRWTIDARQLSVLRGRDLLEALPVQVFEARHGAERRIDAMPVSLATLEHPLQHAHVLAEARPDELALSVATEPVHAENARRMLDRASHLQPMIEIVAHVVATEGEHRQLVAPHYAHLAGDRSGGFRTERGRHVDAFFPARRFDDERHRRGAASAEKESYDRHAFRILPLRFHRM